MNLRNRNIQSPTPTLKREDDASVASEDSLEETVNCPSFFPRLPSLFNADSEERAEGGLSTPEGHERSNQGGQDRSNQGDLQLSEEVQNLENVDIGANSDTITGGEISNQRESRSFKIVDLKPVEVESGEEDEVVIYSQQGELFRLEKTKKGHEDRWKEIGDVDIKILKHKEYGTLRLLMRKRLLVVVNHFLDPRITLKPKEGSELSWVWSDLSKGQPSTGQPYWIRFADSDIADNFNNVFEESQEEMERLLAGEDVANSDERAPDGEFSNQRDQEKKMPPGEGKKQQPPPSSNLPCPPAAEVPAVARAPEASGGSQLDTAASLNEDGASLNANDGPEDNGDGASTSSDMDRVELRKKKNAEAARKSRQKKKEEVQQLRETLNRYETEAESTESLARAIVYTSNNVPPEQVANAIAALRANQDQAMRERERREVREERREVREFQHSNWMSEVNALSHGMNLLSQGGRNQAIFSSSQIISNNTGSPGGHGSYHQFPGMAHPGGFPPYYPFPGMAHPASIPPNHQFPGMAHPTSIPPNHQFPGMAHPGAVPTNRPIPGMAHPGGFPPNHPFPGMVRPDTAAPFQQQPNMRNTNGFSSQFTPSGERPRVEELPTPNPAATPGPQQVNRNLFGTPSPQWTGGYAAPGPPLGFGGPGTPQPGPPGTPYPRDGTHFGPAGTPYPRAGYNGGPAGTPYPRDGNGGRPGNQQQD